jgi:hypothetical protein
MNYKKYIFLSGALFIAFQAFAQDDCYKIFRDESISEFKKTNYQKAIDNLKVASSCEDKPKTNDIYEWIDKNQQCINSKTQADKLLAENNYEIALYFYKQLSKLNPDDEYAKLRITECTEKLRCFPEVRNQGNTAFRESKYDEALQHFEQAQKCEVKPSYNDIELLTENVKQCINFKSKGDSLFALKDYKRANENYFNVLTLNPLDNYCREQIKKIPSDFQQFIEKPIKKGWFFTLNFSSRNTASFYDNTNFKLGDGFIGISGGKLNSWGYYGTITLGSTTLWGLENYESPKYLFQDGIEAAFVFNQIDKKYIESVEDEIYIVDDQILIHKYPDFTRQTSLSFSAGITKRLLNFKKFKMHVSAGLGWANWGAEQKRYRKTDRIQFIPNEPGLYYQLINGDYQTVHLDEYWVEIPENAVLYNFKSAFSWEAGLIFNYNRFTLNMNTSFMLEGADKSYIDTFNQMITIGLGYSW